MIKDDLYRYFPLKYSFLTLVKAFREPGFFYIYLIRKANIYSKYSILGIFYRILHRKYSYKFGFDIAVSTKIGKGFFIGHFGNVVVSPKAIIGDYCNLSQGVTIGRISVGSKMGTPIIGNKVWFGAGCIVVGGITIGDNVLIGPGAFVNFDVPSNSIVIGNPGKIIAKENPTAGYIENILKEN
jgi:serine O-acetyltransferase